MKKMIFLIGLMIPGLFLSAQCDFNIQLNVDNITCNGQSDGVYTAEVVGPAEATTIMIDGPNGYSRTYTNKSFADDGLAAGTYSIYFTQPARCATDTLKFIITDPPAITVTTKKGDATCNDDTGFIQAQVNGGWPPYIYEWSNSSTAAVIGGLPAGIYALTVTDANGCTATLIDSIKNITPVQIDGANITPSCGGQFNGAIDLTVSGGGPPYSFSWSNGVPSEDLGGLPSDVYSVTVTDSNGCTATAAFTVPDSPFDYELQTTDASCNEGGTADITVLDGTPPYEILWQDGNRDFNRSGLASGAYSFTITDSVNCAVMDDFFIDSPLELTVTSTLADCDSLNGTATASISGNALNPQFAWNNGASGAVQTGLAVGDYSVTVTDDNGCRSHRNVRVEVDTNCYLTVSGYVYIETGIKDCMVDSLSVPMARHRINLSNGRSTFTNRDGYYEFELDKTGTYTVEYSSPLGILDTLCLDPIVVNANTYAQTYSNNNFYLKYGDDSDLFFKISKGPARPGFDHSVRICLMNKGKRPEDGTLIFRYDALDSFLRTAPMYDRIDLSEQKIEWDFTDLSPGQVYVYNVYLNLPPTVPLGTMLNYYFEAIPNGKDIDLSNNIETCKVTVRGSYDPNDKQVSPTGRRSSGLLRPGEERLSYHIRFQNTGTDTAFTVVIRDTLDMALDPESIEPGPASHPYELNILDGRTLEFRFENILLPDSNVNLIGSNGFVFFDISPYPGQPLGTTINNSAAIYFDFNKPVITNTVRNTLGDEDVLTEIDTTACGTFELDGVFYDQSIQFIDTIQLALYDSIVMADIRILPEYEASVFNSFCAGEEGMMAGIDTVVYISSLGCDSIVYFNWEELAVPETTLMVSLDPGELYQGQRYDSDTTLVDTLQAANGCDSLVFTQLSILTSNKNLAAAEYMVQLFPNPSQDIIMLEFTAPEPTIFQYELIGPAGRSTGLSGRWEGQQGRASFSIRSLSNGLYFLLIHTPDRIIRKPIIKME